LDADDSSSPDGARAVLAGTCLPGGMDATPGGGGHTDSLATGGLNPTTSAPGGHGPATGGHGPATGGHGSSPAEPAMGAAGDPASTAPGATAPADGPSQATASGAGRPAGRTTATVTLQQAPVVNVHGMRTRGKDGIRQLLTVSTFMRHRCPLCLPQSVLP
jgi:hypothetical protein